jgi:hypothetical protein
LLLYSYHVFEYNNTLIFIYYGSKCNQEQVEQLAAEAWTRQQQQPIPVLEAAYRQTGDSYSPQQV